MKRPRLALCPGDPGGVGPEIVRRVLDDPDFPGRVEMVVFDRAGPGPHPARPTAAGGRASLEAFAAAVEAALAGEVDGVVTGPIDKRSLAAAGSSLPGHTAFLRQRLPDARPLMAMIAPPALRVLLVTDHIRLADVPAAVTAAAVHRTLVDGAGGLVDEFGIAAPRLAVLGLNPHAGDDGVLGDEEMRLLVPALEAARADGVDARGPFPADGFFGSRSDRDHDAVVAMYHDQGLLPVKLLGGWRTVGVTLGLPFVRTSVGHGTAFDAVGRADPTSLREAIAVAAGLFESRNRRSL